MFALSQKSRVPNSIRLESKLNITQAKMNPDPLLEALTCPPNDVPNFTPVSTAMQSLPFSALSWENFERICYRIASREDGVESAERYGRSGQAQQGIDIYSRLPNGKYAVWQAKRYKSYTATDMRSAVTKFVDGSWMPKAQKFYVAVQSLLIDVHFQDAVEEEAAKLQQSAISLIVLGGDNLSARLRAHPDIVLEFFGRACAKEFFGETVNASVLDRLDGTEVAKIRSQLHSVYSARFHLLDKSVEPSTPLSGSTQQSTVSLLDRFTTPDVLVREVYQPHLLKERPAGEHQNDAEYPPGFDLMALPKVDGAGPKEISRRLPIFTWMESANRLAVIGDAGSGKSTVLRCLALDLLGNQSHFPSIGKKWGLHLPLFISFARWVRQTESKGGEVGIKEILRTSLQQQLTADLINYIDRAIDERRIVLFVDGLDEWANEQAARTTLIHLLTVVNAHEIPIVVTARPKGLLKIGAIPSDWGQAAMAPLSSAQQRNIAALWFARSSADTNKEIQAETVSWKTERFFRELRSSRGLETLAETPLLLLGLIALAVRRQVLPVGKPQAFAQLVELLIEIHPESRATAAGDVTSRFSKEANTDVRRSALAALAFEIRSEGGDAGYPIKNALLTIKKFLSLPDGSAYGSEKANSVAQEILSVNAETVGLLVEKAPEEIGFLHASLEEFLASTHIQAWALEDILKFVKDKSGTQRWRNVIVYLVASNTRPSEVVQIIRSIELLSEDVLERSQRRLLLGEILSTAASIPNAVAQELVERSVDVLETSGWSGERSGHLVSLLGAMHSPAVGEQILSKLNSWGVRTEDYLINVYQNVAGWQKSSVQLYVLKRGMLDELQHNRRAAAHAIAVAYKGDLEVRAWLECFFVGTAELQVAAAALEALTIGWSDWDELPTLLVQADASSDPSLNASSIWAKVALKLHTEKDLEKLLDLLPFHSKLPVDDHEIAISALSAGWLDHPEIIELCLDVLDGSGDRQSRQLDSGVAASYLLQCSAKNLRILDWIVKELQKKHPFVSLITMDWGLLLRFADSSNEVREQLIQCIVSDRAHLQEYKIRSVLGTVRDTRLSNFAVEKARSSSGHGVFWYVAPLVEGWAKDTGEVTELCIEIRQWPIDRVANVVSLLPKIWPAHECRQLLISIAQNLPDHRNDTLATGFAEAGSTSTDHDVVNLLVERAKVHRPEIFDGCEAIISKFSDSPVVRSWVLSLLEQRNPPLAAISRAYPCDAEIQRAVCRLVTPLPPSYRQMIIEATANEVDRSSTAKNFLSRYDCEINSDLKVLGATRYYEAVNFIDSSRALYVDRLVDDCMAVGHDHEARRGAAFAGLLILNAIDRFVALEWAGKPLGLGVARFGNESPSLLDLIERKWSVLFETFGCDLVSRLTGLGSDVNMFWTALAPYISRSRNLRAPFIDFCEAHTQTLDAQLLQVLSKELPKSDLLLRHCWRAIDQARQPSNISSWNALQSYFEASVVLKEQFAGCTKISERLEQGFLASQGRHYATALAIYAPLSKCLDGVMEQAVEHARLGGPWYLPILLASERIECGKYTELITEMLGREDHSIWGFQERINVSVRLRMGRDKKVGSLMRQILQGTPNENQVASFPRYLATSGELTGEIYQVCRELLNARAKFKGVPPAGFDAFADLVRPTTHSLLDVLAGS